MESNVDWAALGQAVVRHRKAMGLTTHGLAQRSGVSDTWLRLLEGGSAAHAGLDRVVALAETLNVGVDELLRAAGVRVSTDFDGELLTVYEELNGRERRFLANVAREIVGLRRDGAVADAEVDYIAAYDRENEPEGPVPADEDLE